MSTTSMPYLRMRGGPRIGDGAWVDGVWQDPLDPHPVEPRQRCSREEFDPDYEPERQVMVFKGRI